MLTIELTRTNCTTPFQIYADLSCRNNPAQNREFTRNDSFKETIDLPVGHYFLTIRSMNTPGGSVDIKLTGDFVLPLGQDEYHADKSMYTAFFEFDIIPKVRSYINAAEGEKMEKLQQEIHELRKELQRTRTLPKYEKMEAGQLLFEKTASLIAAYNLEEYDPNINALQFRTQLFIDTVEEIIEGLKS
jgi:hypothetical protein